ncbi:S-layer protein [Thermococcus sp. 21S7]|uniref:S-layer protein n=1 Tax=Thermococcus sp. 21S7 TaxID=1638221 RepID=UPI00143BE440|nr:S-layer protein [Thermococcus sp. 21S7]NJE60846.1 S-layer protein [Thermococcus sp. 21S7]
MKVKKIAALAVGAAMVGATIGFASAQPTVPSIPKDFFVKDGQPNVKIVVGSQGAALDVSSAADIAVALGSLLYTEEDVSVKDASVVVKTDASYDPDDLPVFNNYYAGDYNFKDKQDIAELKHWWNGAYDDGDPVYNVSLDDSAWSGGVYRNYEDVAKAAIEWKDGNDNNYWKDPNGKVHDLTDVKIHYNLTIGEVKLKELAEGDIKTTDMMDFSDFTLVLDDVVANVTFKLTAWSKTIKDKVLGPTGGKAYTVSDLDLQSSGYDKYGTAIEGVEVGDTIDLFGKEVKILDIDSKYIEYGNDWGAVYVDKDSTKQFGDYTVKVADIDVSKTKALLQITGPGINKIVTLDATGQTSPKSWTSPDDGIRVTLLDTFIGIGGTTSAKIEVQTDISYIQQDKEYMPNWIAKFKVDDGKLIWFALVNEDPLKDKQIKLFNTYVVDYKATIKTKVNEDDDKKYGAMDAWVVIDPIKPKWDYETYSVGDEIGDSGYTIDSINATAVPAKAAIPSKVTKPITVLDTEVMEAGLDSVDSNLILIGGPVVNSVTAALADKLGVPSDYDGWKSEYGTGADSGVVKYVAECGDINGYGVVLVAGTDREGTKAAAEALMEYLAGL